MGHPRRTRLGIALVTSTALLAASVLAACGTEVDVPVGTEAACGEAIASDGVTLEGLTAQDVLLVESSFALESVVVYDDGRVAVVGTTASEWTRELERRAADEAAEADAANATAAALAVAAPAPPRAAVVPAMAWMPHPESPYLLAGRLPACALDDLDALAHELRDVVAATDGDLGDPMITDSPTTTLDFRGDPAVEASAYALNQGFEDGLTREERRGRAFMRAMQDAVTFNLTDVVEVAPDAFEFYPDWSGACEPITDPDDVAAVLAAHQQGDDDVEARAVPPGIDPCS